MKILYVITSMGVKWGGPALTTMLSARGIREKGYTPSILTYDVAGDDRSIVSADYMTCLPPLGFWGRRSGFSFSMQKALEKEKADIYHIQGLWQYPCYKAAQVASKRKKPYIVTLHGQLYPQALALSGRKKRWALTLFQGRQLEGAACVQATCMEELNHYRDLGFTTPVALIPNPIDCGEVPLYTCARERIRVGYLGRIHPRKNILGLLEVWQRVGEPSWELLIMGDGDGRYLDFLKSKVRESRLENVRFTGFVSGEEKGRLLASLSCLVVPSDFENFGMIVPEALLQEVPVIASKGTPWEELERVGCGRWVKNDVDTLSIVLKETLSLPPSRLRAMGKKGRTWIMGRFALPVVSAQMKQMYEWVINPETEKPEFIYL